MSNAVDATHLDTAVSHCTSTPSERYYTERERSPKKLNDWARQMVFQLHRWLPEQAPIVMGHSIYSALQFLHAALYEPALLYSGKGRPCKKGKLLLASRQIIKNQCIIYRAIKII